MYRKNPMKAKLSQGLQVLGCWLQTTSAEAAEIAALAGFDFVLIDHEHGPATLEDAMNQMRGLQGTDTASVMRVPWNDPIYLKRALDAGVEGVMIPMVETAEAAKAAVAACRYPPAGWRGAASTTRAASYGFAGDYPATAAGELLIVCQIESAAAVERIADIGAVDGVDMLFIGPRDLSGSIGRLGQFEDPEVKALIARAERAVLDTGRWLGGIAGNAADARLLLDRGYNMVSPASDVGLLKSGATAVLRDLRG